MARFGIVALLNIYDRFDWTSFSSYFHWMSQNKLCLVCDHWKQSFYLFSCCLTLLFVFRCWRWQYKQLSHVLLWIKTAPLFLRYGFWLKVRIITLFCTAVIFLRILLCFVLKSNLFSCDLFKDTPLVFFFYQLSNRSIVYLQFVNIP